MIVIFLTVNILAHLLQKQPQIIVAQSCVSVYV